MYRRPHHQKIHGILNAMNADFLRDSKCYFGGGTAISMLLGEYRESVDIDFLCADQEGYRKLRASIFAKGLSELFPATVETLRDVRADRDGIRTILVSDGTPIKFEIVREARIELVLEPDNCETTVKGSSFRRRPESRATERITWPSGYRPSPV